MRPAIATIALYSEKPNVGANKLNTANVLGWLHEVVPSTEMSVHEICVEFVLASSILECSVSCDRVCACRTSLWYVTTVAALGATLGVEPPLSGKGTCDAGTLSLAAPFYVLVGGSWSRGLEWLAGVTVCRGLAP